MKREELIRELKTCANCTVLCAEACPHGTKCSQYRNDLLWQAAEALEHDDKEARDE